VEFQCSSDTTLVPSFALRTKSWYNVKLIRFTIQHTKNIRAGYGIPICFTTTDATDDTLAFLQLVYLWAHLSDRRPSDPFLSYRSRDGHLTCLVYTQVQKAITQCAGDFGFNPEWFKPHCIRMAAQVLTFGRWKSVPTSFVYQGPSSKNNNRVLQLHQLSTEEPCCCSWMMVLRYNLISDSASKNKANRQPTVRRV
jgi:hypothetical protein